MLRSARRSCAPAGPGRGKVIVRIAALAVALGLASSAHAQLVAGAGKAEVALTPDMLPIDGFTTVLDPLEARVLVLLEDGHKAAIAVLDQTSIGAETVAEYKAIVAREIGTDPARVWIVASHTFSAPHWFPPRAGTAQAGAGGAEARYKAALVAALSAAARKAASSSRPARFGFGAAESAVNVNRNVPMADGWWLGANETGPVDRSLGLLRIDGLDGKPIAALLNYAVQSSVMDQTGGPGGTKAVTADLGGFAVRHVERAVGGEVIALFLTGAAGDQSPRYTARRNVYDLAGKLTTVDIGAAGYSLAELQGERVGGEALRRYATLAPSVTQARLAVTGDTIELAAQDRPRSLGQIRPSRSYAYPLKGRATAPFALIRLGDLALVGVQVELNAVSGQAIKRRSPFAHTMVVTMVNGAAKYLPDATGYRDITYQAMNSSYAPGGAERLVDSIVAGLRQLKSGKAR